MRNNEVMTVEAEARLSVATAQIARFHSTVPTDVVAQEKEVYWLDLCLTPRPRNARACYREHWSPHRFERFGNVFVLPPHEMIQTRSDGGTAQTSVVCQLNPGAMSQWFDGELVWTDRRLEASLNIPDASIRSLLLRMEDELRNPGFAAEMLMELIVGQLAIELGRYCTSIAEGPATGGLAPWRLRLIDERLREVREAPTLSELAQLCNLSVRQLTRGFRVSRGCSIGDHVAAGRLDSAKRMLASDQSVKAIAYSLGFASPSSFCFAFRRATGETPRQYRQRSRGAPH